MHNSDNFIGKTIYGDSEDQHTLVLEKIVSLL